MPPRPRPVELLTLDEIGALIRAWRRAPTGIGNRAIIIMARRAGLRGDRSVSVVEDEK